MRTAIIIAVGFVLWAACLGVAKLLASSNTSSIDHSDRRVCRHLVCRCSSEHVDWCVASGVFVSSSATGFPVDLLVAIRGGNLCKVEVPLSASTF